LKIARENIHGGNEDVTYLPMNTENAENYLLDPVGFSRL